MAGDEASGFLSRWARRKERARSGAALAPEPAKPALVEVTAVAALVEVQAVPAIEASLPAEASPAAPPVPTLADVAALTRESDYTRFVAAGVDEGVKRAAMKKLFSDPHFNIMDGLDTYIDDYGKPDPIPIAMLREMNQSKFLRLFDDEEEDAKAQPASLALADTPEPPSPSDDHADLRLQQDDAAGRPGPDQGAGA